MGFGIALGGAARGLESAERTFAERRRSDIQQQGNLADQKLRERALGIKQRQLALGQRNALLSVTRERIDAGMKFIEGIVERSRGKVSPEQLQSTLEPFFGGLEQVAAEAGDDPTMLRRQFNALVSAPVGVDPAEEVQSLRADKLRRESAGDVARLEDVAFSASDALDALDTLEKIPGGEVFLLNPGLITPARQALASKEGGGWLGTFQRAIGANELPSQLTGLTEDQLITALDAAETVNKQRNALVTGLSNQAGTAGLRSQLQARGEGAGLSVQRKVFGQALDLARRELGVEASKGPLPLPETEAELKKGQVYDLPDGRQALWNGKELELLN